MNKRIKKKKRFIKTKEGKKNKFFNFMSININKKYKIFYNTY